MWISLKICSHDAFCIIRIFCTIKAGANEEKLLQKQNWVQDAKICFWKISEAYFAFKTQILCLQHMLRGVANKETFENTEEALTFKVSQLFPRLCAKATLYSEDAEFASRKQKCSASFSIAHPCNIVINIDSKCFPGNVSSFAPASMLKSKRYLLI